MLIKMFALFCSCNSPLRVGVVDWFDGYDLDGPDEIVIGDRSYPEDISKKNQKY